MNLFGFDVKIFLDQDLVQDYLCSICLGVLNNPKNTSNGCEFCAACISETIISNKSKRVPLKCPTCRIENVTESNLNFCRRSRVVVSGLGVQCHNFENEVPCDWKGTIADYEAHYLICPFTETDCEFFDTCCSFEGCNGKVVRRDSTKHFAPSVQSLLVRIKELISQKSSLAEQAVDLSMKIEALQVEKTEQAEELLAARREIQETSALVEVQRTHVNSILAEKEAISTHCEALENHVKQLERTHTEKLAEFIQFREQLQLEVKNHLREKRDAAQAGCMIKKFDEGASVYCGERDLLQRRHGFGLLKFSAEHWFQGQWVHGRMEGIGWSRETNGNSYNGYFVNNLKHGQGVMKYGGGEQYTGDWLKGAMHGKGHLTYPNGDEYTGSFANDVFCGHGTMKYADGRVYEGQLRKGQFNGVGVLTLPSGEVHSGTFVNGAGSYDIVVTSVPNTTASTTASSARPAENIPTSTSKKIRSATKKVITATTATAPSPEVTTSAAEHHTAKVSVDAVNTSLEAGELLQQPLLSPTDDTFTTAEQINHQSQELNASTLPHTTNRNDHETAVPVAASEEEDGFHSCESGAEDESDESDDGESTSEKIIVKNEEEDEKRELKRQRLDAFVPIAWTAETDEMLTRAVKQCGDRWTAVASCLSTSIDLGVYAARQCAHRWRNNPLMQGRRALHEWTLAQLQQLTQEVRSQTSLRVRWEAIGFKLHASAQDCCDKWMDMARLEGRRGPLTPEEVAMIEQRQPKERAPGLKRKLPPKLSIGNWTELARRMNRISGQDLHSEWVNYQQSSTVTAVSNSTTATSCNDRTPSCVV